MFESCDVVFEMTFQLGASSIIDRRSDSQNHLYLDGTNNNNNDQHYYITMAGPSSEDGDATTFRSKVNLMKSWKPENPPSVSQNDYRKIIMKQAVFLFENVS